MSTKKAKQLRKRSRERWALQLTVMRAGPKPQLDVPLVEPEIVAYTPALPSGAEVPIGTALNWWVQTVRCIRCGADLTGVPFHIDHVHPKSRGGPDKPENFQLLCAKCNMAKGALTMIEWAPWLVADDGHILTWRELQTEAESKAALPKYKKPRGHRRHRSHNIYHHQVRLRGLVGPLPGR
jgi:hypothetical protein